MIPIQSAKKLTYGSLLCALVMITTAFIKLPSPLGYIHLGDGAIFLSSALMGPYGGLVAAVGSALADLLSGFPVYAPVTFVIKGLMGALAGFILAKRDSRATVLVTLILLEVFSVFAYYLFDAVLYGHVAALPAAGFNCIQAGAGILLGYAAIRLLNPHR